MPWLYNYGRMYRSPVAERSHHSSQIEVHLVDVWSLSTDIPPRLFLSVVEGCETTDSLCKVCVYDRSVLLL